MILLFKHLFKHLHFESTAILSRIYLTADVLFVKSFERFELIIGKTSIHRLILSSLFAADCLMSDVGFLVSVGNILDERY